MMDKDTIITGDCFEKLDELPEESAHAVVTDPPYGLAFMGRDWDDFDPKEYQQFCERWATACKRVLKPGGHLLAFSGNRTHHRAFAGVEDAGFEIRDTLTWHYGSGFPKAADIGKTIDKRADAEREKVPNPLADKQTGQEDSNALSTDREPNNTIAPEPATDAAKKWDGWKTGLKPATEYVVMARKPFDGATVDCVQEHGTGALNIEACRVDTDSEELSFSDSERDSGKLNGRETGTDKVATDPSDAGKGRYPSNVIFHADEAARLDREVGELDAGTFPDKRTPNEIYAGGDGAKEQPDYNKVERNDNGGPSRYFYTSKASKAERTNDGQIDNAHPTVKPQDLMEWLVKLVTREGQTVIDPFCGSGTTCMAAKQLGRQFIGIEKQAQWADVARARVGLTPHDPSHIRDDEQQSGLAEFGETND